MSFYTKALWAEGIITDILVKRLKQHLADTGANALFIRTDSQFIPSLIKDLHPQGIRVCGWRWPHAVASTPNPANDPSFAPNEMNRVIGLIGQGLDGYVFDIESNGDGKPNDWGNKGPANRSAVASAMVAGIVNAFKARETAYLLGLTSHQWGFSNYPGIPWQPFLDECNALFPQTYWQADNGSHDVKACNAASYDYSGHPTPVGTVDQALLNGFKDYANKKDRDGNVIPIIALGGEIGCTKA